MPKKDYIRHPHYGFKISVEEEWRDVPGYEGRYRVSSRGRVQSMARPVFNRAGRLHYTQRERILSVCIAPDGGYPFVNLCKMKQWPYLIHRLVLLAFVGQAPKGLECRHLDGNPKNNRLENLCWGSSQEQADDRKRHGTNVGNRGRTKGFHYNQGESSGNAKMTERLVIKIRKLAARGCPCTEIANRYRLHPSTVNAAVLGKTWKHVEGL